MYSKPPHTVSIDCNCHICCHVTGRPVILPLQSELQSIAKTKEYEYSVKIFEDYKNAVTAYKENGWEKAWADISTSGAFVVYRRKINT